MENKRKVALCLQTVVYKQLFMQGAQIQLKILVTPLTVPAMRLERRLGYETEERRLHILLNTLVADLIKKVNIIRLDGEQC